MTERDQVIGWPVHRTAAWIRLSTGEIYFIAACGTKGLSDAAPVPLDDEDERCVMCWFEVAERAA